MSSCTIYTPGKLLVSIVPRHQGDIVVAATKKAGAPGGTVMLGRGTASNHILRLLCLGDTSKDLVLTLATAADMGRITHALRQDERLRKKAPGIGFVLDVPGILRHMASQTPVQPSMSDTGESMSSTAGHQLICVIINRGYAEDVMHTAREAGATGGTIVNARGTGREEDVKFFGITIVPEKEFLMILAARDAAPGILDAIRQTPCLNEPGIGIAFCLDVEDFFPLGRGGRAC
ncbi:MAG: P-II family nitrogen regulator [Desulfovibrio sp.]|nr:P-II family nitrogen regulator [Desulfovibrio sp.]